MNRTQTARALLILGTILVSVPMLPLLGLLGPDVLHGSEWLAAPTFDRGLKLQPMDPSQTCEARYVTAGGNSNYIVASDCNLYNSDNFGKICIRCNGKYWMDTGNNTPPGGPGVSSGFSASCGDVEEGVCSPGHNGCVGYLMTNKKCGDVTEYLKQPIVDPNDSNQDDR